MPGLQSKTRPTCRLEKLPRDVEPDIPVFAVSPTLRELCHRRPDTVREIELEHVAAGAFLDTERPIGHTRSEPNPRDELADDIDRGTDSKTAAQAEQERMVVLSQLN